MVEYRRPNIVLIMFEKVMAMPWRMGKTPAFRFRSTVTTRVAPISVSYQKSGQQRERRGARVARRDDRSVPVRYVGEEQRSEPGCIGARMRPDFWGETLGPRLLGGGAVGGDDAP